MPASKTGHDTSTPSTQWNAVYKHLLGDYVHQYRWTLVAFFVVILFTLPLENVALPCFYGQMLELVGGKKGPMAAIGTDVWNQIASGNAVGCLYVIAALWLVVVVAYVLKNTLEGQLYPTYLSFVRQRLFDGTVERHSQHYKDIKVGEELARIIDVSRNMSQSVLWFLGELVPLYLAVLAMVGYLLYVNVPVGIAVAVGAVVHTVVFVVMGYKCVRVSSTREQYYLQMSEKLNDSFSNLMNVYLNNMKRAELRKNRRTEALHAALYKEQFRCTRNTVAVLSLVAVLTFVCTVGVMYEQLRRGTVTSAAFVAMWFILILYMANLLRLADGVPDYLTKLGIVHCSRDYLRNLVASDEVRAVKDAVTRGRLQFKDVVFTYPGGAAPILSGFTLDVAAGEKVGILGTSGSGKTTAMKLLSGMHAPDSGSLRIDGHAIETIDVHHLRRRIVYVNQRTQLFNTSILKNIQYGNKVSAKEVDTLLARYELNAVYAKLPQGVYTNAGVNGTGLSLGMQKVTMLVRGLLRDGKVVVLDEPLAGLDAATRKKVLRLIKDRCAGKTTLVITHDKEIIPYMDRVVNIAEINQATPQREGFANPLRRWLGF